MENTKDIIEEIGEALDRAQKFSYRPLPKILRIGDSKIEGQGLFTTEDIPVGMLLGISHHEKLDGTIIRTPLGGFVNHKDCGESNCELFKIGNKYFLKTTKLILASEELTLTYGAVCGKKDC